MDFIKLEERAPEFGTEVILAGEGQVKLGYLQSITRTSSGTTYDFSENEIGTNPIWFSVKCWMPKPEPPDYAQKKQG